VLDLMKRKYTTELFASRISRIRELLPEAFIGVDVIAGTNGETDELFEKSYEFLNGMDVCQLHAFPYSERSGTQALKIPHKVTPEERKHRTQRLINLSEKKLRAFYERNLGTVHTVLFEEQTNGDRMEGFTENYIRVEAELQPSLINRPARVKLVSILPGGQAAGVNLE
jgi:threonylcarbamoyladenosine tRNA methylthiotransferase MtaB